MVTRRNRINVTDGFVKGLALGFHMPTYLGFDIGSNSVGSVWTDTDSGEITAGVSIFPAGVDESDDKRGDPKNAKRRMTRRTRITLRRRATRKRELRLKLIEVGLLPPTSEEFKRLLETTDPWELRRRGLAEPLTAHQFGRVLLHLAQRRGALGLKLAEPDETDDGDSGDDGKVKAAINEVRAKMRDLNVGTFGEFIAAIRAQRVTAITTPDRRPTDKRKGPREFRAAVRNKPGIYEHCADREMIRDEFRRLWDKQKSLAGEPAPLLTDELRRTLDDESGDAIWRHRGLLFGQRRASWDLGTLGRCVLEPTERCAPHADMYASCYLVIETVNNLKIIERGKPPRPLTVEEREKIRAYLSGPLGMEKPKKTKKANGSAAERPKTKVTVSDLRRLMGTADEGWGERFSKHSQFRFNIEADENREINTDWFSREIVHGAVTLDKWSAMRANVREGINRAILKFDPEQEGAAERLKSGVMTWAALSETQADALVAAWKRRPKLDAKRLKMSRRAVCKILPYMDEAFTEVDGQDGQIPVRWRKDTAFDPARHRWMTQIEARKAHAQAVKRKLTEALLEEGLSSSEAHENAENSPEFKRYATGAKGATARDRHYLAKHVLYHNGEPVLDCDGKPLAEPPPAPLLSNPVVRKAIHEVRRHLVEYMVTFRRRPDYVFIELAREARMGKKDADRLLFKNRLRNRIRNDILEEFNLHSVSATQQRAAVDRVVLAVQQGCICPLCGKRIGPDGNDGLTLRKAAIGEGCEVAHIIPRASGGHNGLGNIVLAHTKCNREMERRTPRQFWELTLPGGFAEGIAWAEKMYADVERPKASDMKNANGMALWSCYFRAWDDKAKLDQFKKEVKDIREMTARQEAATKYATRQVMAYLADAIYDGKGLPERGGERRIFTTDGIWTSRLRREWGLFFDRHDKKRKGLTTEQEQQRREKDRGDHRHHAIDAVVIALTTEQVRADWDKREMRADVEGVNTADEQQMENYRRAHPISPPRPFNTGDKLREAVEDAVFGDGPVERPVCHRHVKRKLIGALHKATQYGPVVDVWKQNGTVHCELVKTRVTVRQAVIGEAPTDFLKPTHLRLPREESDDEAIERLARRFRVGKKRLSAPEAEKAARRFIKSNAFTRRIVDPKPEKGGIVRDPGLRRLLRRRIEQRGLNPDSFTKVELKRSIDLHGPLTQDSGVPIHSVVLLWSNNDPVTVGRDHCDYATGKRRKLDDPTSIRLYDGQNNHHIEVRVRANKKGVEVWKGEVVSAFEAAQRKLAKLRAVRKADIPKPTDFRKLSKAERAKYRPLLREIESAHPLVDRSDNEKDGRFVMSLCEGEMLMMKGKPAKKGEPPGPVGYFVVAKLDKPNGIVLVPHWDARAAGERKDAEGKKVPNSKREQFTATPSDLKELAPPGKPHAAKVRVSPLGKIAELVRD